MNFKLSFLFIINIAFGLFSLISSAEPTRVQGMTIQAENMTRDTEHDIVELEGGVQVIFNTQHLKAQKAKINLRSKTLDAAGDVLVTSTQANIGGDRVILDYESNTGIIYNGYVQSGTVLFEGSLITKTSDVDYLADDAKYTACTTCPEAWSFSGKKIRAELGGYAYIKNSMMKFGGVPFFWFPYLVVPLKSDRQTGLLTPSISTEDPGGLIYSQGFFWAIDRSHDATFTFTNYEQRGLKSLVEYNYVLDQHSSGVLKTGFLRDRVFATQDRLNQYRPTSQKNDQINRWFINYDHYFELPEGYIQRAQINNSSDIQYNKDFDTETKGNLDPALENRVSLTHNNLNQHFSIDSSYYINLLQPNPLAGNDDTVHRLPEIRFSQTMTQIKESSWLYTIDANFVNFSRNGPGYDDLNAAYDANAATNDRYKANTCNKNSWDSDPLCREVRDGKYDSGKDLIRTGQRIDVKPTLYRPFHLGNSLDILPKVSYRETQYNFSVGDQSSVARRYLRTEIAAKATTSAIYGDLTKPLGERLKHDIQPEISFNAIPWLYQPNHPFFGAQTAQDLPPLSDAQVVDSDLNSKYGLQFDYSDRVYDRKLVTLAVTNNLTQKTWVSDLPQYFQFFSWRLAQSYDLYQFERDPSTKQAFTAVTSDMRLTLPRLQLSNQASYYPYQQVTNSTTTLRIDNDRDDAALLKYTRNISFERGKDPDPTTDPNQDVSLMLRKFTKMADFIAMTTYDLNSNAPRRVKLWAYGAEFKIPGDCASISITEKIENEKRSRTYFFKFVWDGQSKSNFIRTISGIAPYGI